MSAFRVQAESIEIPANRISLYIPEGEAVTTWDAIMRVFYPGGLPARNLPLGSYRVKVFRNSMDHCETSTYRFN